MSSDIIAMAREAGAIILDGSDTSVIKRLVQLVQAAERNKVAAWMIAQGYATGHGETMEGLLEELEREVGFKRAELWIKRISEAVLAEREACLNCYSPDDTAQDWADKIRARSDK
jgi:hypothetical protein